MDCTKRQRFKLLKGIKKCVNIASNSRVELVELADWQVIEYLL